MHAQYVSSGSTLALHSIKLRQFVVPNASRPRTAPLHFLPRHRPRTAAAAAAETCVQAAKTRLGHATTRPTTGENPTVRVYLCYTAVVPLHGIHMASCKPTFMLYRRRPDTFLAVAPPNAEIGRDRSVKSPENVPISSSGTACRCVCRACKVAQRPQNTI